MFLWISWDFADLPEFCGSATARNIRRPDLYTWAIEKNGTVRESQGIVGRDNTNVNYVIVILRGWCCDIHSFYSIETSSPHATALGQTMQNIVTATHQEGIISHYSLLKTLNKSLRTSLEPISSACWSKNNFGEIHISLGLDWACLSLYHYSLLT